MQSNRLVNGQRICQSNALVIAMKILWAIQSKSFF